MKEAIEEILDHVDQEEFYKEYLPDISFNSTGLAKNVICPFHEDKTPSLSISIEKGWKCFGCDASGQNIVGFFWKWSEVVFNQKIKFNTAVMKMYKKYVHPLVNPKIVTNWHNTLLQNVTIQAKLKDRGIFLSDIKKYNLGYDTDDERISGPILNAYGWFVDTRKISLKSKEELKNRPKNLPYDYLTATKKRENGEKTYGEGASIFPYDNIYEKKIVVCEGAFDAIILNRWGFNTITTGSCTDTKDLIPLLKDKVVFICFDNDGPGKTAAQKLLSKLYPIAAEVRNITLPMKDGDVTDYWKAGYRGKDFSKLMESSSVKDFDVSEETGIAKEVVNIDSLADICNSKNYGKHCVTVARISGEEELHYSVPKSYTFKCEMDNGKKCRRCPVSAQGGKFHGNIDLSDNSILSLIGLTDKKLNHALATRHEIVADCTKFTLERNIVVGIQEVLLSPPLERRKDTITKDNVKAFNLCGTVELNAEYKLSGYVTHYPNTQQTTLVMLEAKRQDLQMDNFVIPKKAKITELKNKFNPEELTPESILEKHSELMDILAHNVTNIYERNDFHSIVDLTFHSPLEMIFDGMAENSYMETVIIGDTNTGKDRVVEGLSKYYNAGMVLDSGACTTVGLIGGMVLKKYFSWGSYIQQHRKLLALNEGSHLSKSIEALRTVREGTAYYNKADAKRSTDCQVRLIIMANDPSGYISSNPYPIQALSNLFGKEADISRFTTAFFLRVEDTPHDIINSKNPPKIKTNISREDFQFKVANAWALKAEDIIFPNGSVEKCYELAREMAKKYECSLPLVQSSVQWKKIAKVASALAAALYHMNEDGTKLLVPYQFMIAAAKLLEAHYDNEACEYNLLAEQEKAKLAISDVNMVMTTTFDKERTEGGTGNIFHCLQFLISRREFSPGCMQDAFLFCTDFVISKEIIKVLLLNNCIERSGPNYIKTKAFTKLLKELLQKEKGRK